MAKPLSGQEKVALFLSSLDADAAQAILVRLGPQPSAFLRAEMQRLAQIPDARAAQNSVLQEFVDLLERGSDERKPNLRIVGGSAPDDVGTATRAGLRVVSPPVDEAEGTDPLDALRRLPAAELARALEGEQPRTMALVLNYVDTPVAGEVLRLLPAEARKSVSVQMSLGSGNSMEVVVHIARALLRKRQSLGDSSYTLSNDAKARRLAEMLRDMDRAERLDILAALEQRDPTTAAQVKDCLYAFDDLGVIADRSVQKILAEIDSKTLATALKNAPAEIVDKVMNNLSQRARESLTDEIGFLGPVATAQIEQARKVIIEVIRRLDASGDLVMEQ